MYKLDDIASQMQFVLLTVLMHREILEVQILDALKVFVAVVHQLFGFQFIERRSRVC